MFPVTLDLLNRIKDSFHEEREWFDILRHWYKNVSLTHRALEAMMATEELDLLSLGINHQTARQPVVPQVKDRLVYFKIPEDAMHPGENTFLVRFSPYAKSPLVLDATMIYQNASTPMHTVNLTNATPEPTRDFQIIGSGETTINTATWSVHPGGFLMFRYYLPQLAPMIIALRMPAGQAFPLSVARDVRQQKVLKEIAQRVKQKIKKRIQELEAQHQQSQELLDLQSYEQLFRDQIALAMEPNQTLEQAIQWSQNPDQLVLSSPRVQPEVVQLTQAPVAPMARPVYQAQPVYQPQPRPAKLPPMRPPVQSSGYIGKLLLTLFVAGIGVGGFAAWKSGKLDEVTQLVQNTWNKVVNKKGDVLTAMNASATDIGWKPDVQKEISIADMKQKMVQFSGLTGVGEKDVVISDKMKLYFVGKRDAKDEPIFEQTIGIPMCNKMMFVLDAENEANARKFYGMFKTNTEKANDNDLMKQMGATMTANAKSIANADEAMIVSSNPGGVTYSVARQGKFLMMITVLDKECKENEPASHEKALTSLNAKLKQIK